MPRTLRRFCARGERPRRERRPADPLPVGAPRGSSSAARHRPRAAIARRQSCMAGRRRDRSTAAHAEAARWWAGSSRGCVGRRGADVHSLARRSTYRSLTRARMQTADKSAWPGEHGSDAALPGDGINDGPAAVCGAPAPATLRAGATSSRRARAASCDRASPAERDRCRGRHARLAGAACTGRRSSSRGRRPHRPDAASAGAALAIADATARPEQPVAPGPRRRISADRRHGCNRGVAPDAPSSGLGHVALHHADGKAGRCR